MILKGGPRSKGRELATHLGRTDTNETVRLLDRQNVVGTTIKDVLVEMEALAMGGRSSKPLYHCSISPERDEKLSDEQWRIAADKLGEALGLSGHQRLIVLHLKEGSDGQLREHGHVVWGRTDPETLKTAHHSHNYRTHEEVARALEKEFGLHRTQGVHAERDPEQPKKNRRRTKADERQEARTGWKKADSQAAIAAAWSASENGAAFRAHLAEHRHILARGDERDFVVVDPAGGIHSIRSGVRGLKAAEVRHRLRDLKPEALPSVAEAQQTARAAWQARDQGKDKGDRQPSSKPTMDAPRASYRPHGPTPGQYDALRAIPASPPPRSAPSAPTPEVQARRPAQAPPQPRPTPPSWARDEVKAPPPPRPERPAAAPQPASSAGLDALHARQAASLSSELDQLGRFHAGQRAALDRHHEARRHTVTAEADSEINRLNGLMSRAGGLIDRAAREREIAYQVARRQRGLQDELDRQQRAKADLEAAQARERQALEQRAAARHRLEEDALRRRESNRARPAPTRPRDREPD